MTPIRSERSPPERVILGIDPGIAITGYACIRERDAGLQLLACDIIRTPKGMLLPDRLHLLYEQVTALLTDYPISEAAMELLFFGKNRKTGMAVSHARGVVMLALNQARLPLAEYAPTQVKLAVAGHGNAKKAQVGEMVRELLALSAVPRPDDAADAAAVAICHAQMSTWCSPRSQPP